MASPNKNEFVTMTCEAVPQLDIGPQKEEPDTLTQPQVVHVPSKVYGINGVETNLDNLIKIHGRQSALILSAIHEDLVLCICHDTPIRRFRRPLKVDVDWVAAAV